MAKPTKPAAPAAAPQPAPPPAPPARPRKAFTMERVDGGWQLVTLTYAKEPGGDRLVAVERTEPELKAMTIERFKIAAFKYWTGGTE